MTVPRRRGQAARRDRQGRRPRRRARQHQLRRPAAGRHGRSGGDLRRVASRVILRDICSSCARRRQLEQLGQRHRRTPSITLALTDAQAQKLLFAIKNGDWWLVLRPVARPADSPESVETIESMLTDGLGAAGARAAHRRQRRGEASAVAASVGSNPSRISGRVVVLVSGTAGTRGRPVPPRRPPRPRAPQLPERGRQPHADRERRRRAPRGRRGLADRPRGRRAARADDAPRSCSRCVGSSREGLVDEALEASLSDILILPQPADMIAFSLRKAARDRAGRPGQGFEGDHGLLDEGRDRQDVDRRQPRRAASRRPGCGRC